jgi:hypothetical protein
VTRPLALASRLANKSLKDKTIVEDVAEGVV